MEDMPLHDGDDELTSSRKENRTLTIMGVLLAVVILVMAYLTLFVDDPWKFFHSNDQQVQLSAQPVQPLNKAAEMSDEEVRQSLVKFIEAFYFDQQRGYFDPPSYFAPITETFYNYHNLTYQRLKEQYWNRRKDMENLQTNWVPSSLEFHRDSSRLTVTYWITENYFRPSRHARQSADVRNELVIDENGKIVSVRELEVKNFESTGSFTDSPADSIDSATTPAAVSPAALQVETPAAEVVVNDQKVYELGSVDVSPEFPGGQKELLKFLGKNLRYPSAARQSETEGKVFIGFIIEKNGAVTDVKVLRGIGSGCDEEALRVVKTLPAWKPATISGKPVRNAYVLSVAFKLTE